MVSWKYRLNLCSLREMAVQKFPQIYLRFPLFGKCIKWVFQVYCRRFLVGRDSLKVKRIIKVKFLWVIAATAGHFNEWVNVFLEKCSRDAFRGTLNMVVAPKWFHNGFYKFRYITYTRSVTDTSQRCQDADTSQKLV